MVSVLYLEHVFEFAVGVTYHFFLCILFNGT